MLAMLNPCLCGGAVYIRWQWAGEEAYTAKSVLLHSSIKRDSNQSINTQKLWRSDSEAKPQPWHDNDFSEQKQNSSMQTVLHWSLLDMRQGNGKKSWMFIFIRLGLALNWKLAFLGGFVQNKTKAEWMDWLIPDDAANKMSVKMAYRMRMKLYLQHADTVFFSEILLRLYFILF